MAVGGNQIQRYQYAGVVLLVLVTLASARWWDRNETSEGIKVLKETAQTDAPWPGLSWLERISSYESTSEYVLNNKTYSSVYEAILFGVESPTPTAFSCRNLNVFVNTWIIPTGVAAAVVDSVGVEWGHYAVSYLRNIVLAMVVYYGIAMIFHYHCYIHPRAERIFKDRQRPEWSTIRDQIQLAQSSIFLYTLLPVLDEWLSESNLTMIYYNISDIGGWFWYNIMTVIYFAGVEVCIYWMHRTLHTNKFLYKHVHMLHHKYNTAEMMSPWASIAFHPLDGILQASPYVALTFVWPCHYLTHVIMLFFTAVWATYIHDGMDWNIGPIMGSKYHTLHHTHYIYNYGQVFVWCDQFFGTFREPLGPTGSQKPRTKKQS